MAINLQHQTAAEFIARFRKAYKDSDRERCARLAKWLIARVQAGEITQVQVKTAFGLSDAQWIVLKAKMQSLVANYDAVQAAQGE